MKKKEIVIIISALLFVAVACKKTETVTPVRLFRPVIAGSLVADSNAILAGWQKIKGAASYTVQVSRDTFRTVDVTVNVADTGLALIKNLQWDKLYQVQVKANAWDTVLNSKWSPLGAIRTPRFPTIVVTPSRSDITENAIRLSWINSGAPVTAIRVLKASDSSLATQVTLTAADIAAQFKIVTGLSPATPYIIFLYSGATIRGWENFETKSPLSGNLVDLRGITGRPTVLADTIPAIASGSTIVLKRGETYTISSAVNLSKAVTITSGSDLAIPSPAIIYFTSNFNFAAGANIDYIDFRDVTMRSDAYGSRYIFNTTASATVGRISFDNCTVEIFRGMIRLQSGTTTLTDLTVNNCIIDSIASYGVITVDNVSCRADNISIRNSTIYKAEKIVTSRQNSNSVTIENCTINEAPLGGNYVVDYGTTGSMTITLGVKLTNCIMGVGKSNAGATAVRGLRLTGNIEVSNNFNTSDYTLTAATPSPIPGITPYARKSTEIWQDPVNGNFKIIDSGFPGRSTSGDPRWKL